MLLSFLNEKQRRNDHAYPAYLPTRRFPVPRNLLVPGSKMKAPAFSVEPFCRGAAVSCCAGTEAPLQDLQKVLMEAEAACDAQEYELCCHLTCKAMQLADGLVEWQGICHALLAECYEKQRKFPEACAECERAISKISSVRTHLGRIVATRIRHARMMAELGGEQAAVQGLKSLLRAAPSIGEARARLAQIYFDLEDAASAASLLAAPEAQSLAKAPKLHFQALLLLTVCCVCLEQDEAAEVCLGSLQNKISGLADIQGLERTLGGLFAFGWLVSIRLGKMEGAEETLSALEEDPDMKPWAYVASSCHLARSTPQGLCPITGVQQSANTQAGC